MDIQAIREAYSVMPDSKLAEEYIKLLDFVTAQESQTAKVKDALKVIETIMLDRLTAAELTQLQFPHAKIVRKVNTKYQLPASNDEPFIDWLLNTFQQNPRFMFSYFTHAVSQAAIKEYVDKYNMTPPGIETNTYSKISITKIR